MLQTNRQAGHCAGSTRKRLLLCLNELRSQRRGEQAEGDDQPECSEPHGGLLASRTNKTPPLVCVTRKGME